jgi:hypothetical protein
MKFLCTFFIALSCMSSASASDASIYTLYRTYVGKSDGRVHLATFDAKESKSVNQGNCQATADLWNKREKSAKFWCELGRYKE